MAYSEARESDNLLEFDDSALDELREDLGDAFVARLVGSCAADVADILEKMPATYAAEDEKMTRALAHKLRGLCAQFGALEAERAASETETCGSDKIEHRLVWLRDAATRALARFERIRDGE
jgi:HPt (histidine-containing phosphotransfer) domain-containing protein